MIIHTHKISLMIQFASGNGWVRKQGFLGFRTHGNPVTITVDRTQRKASAKFEKNRIPHPPGRPHFIKKAAAPSRILCSVQPPRFRTFFRHYFAIASLLFRMAPERRVALVDDELL